MAEPTRQWQLALEQPGSADEKTRRLSIGFAIVILVIATAVVAWGHVQLPAYPQFSTGHASIVFILDAVTGWMLLGQFHYRRHRIYVILGCAYLFSSFVMLPFLLSFPGALLATGGLIGGSQSSIWVWHLWHLVFPALVLVALAAEARAPDARLPSQQLAGATAMSIAGALLLALAVTLAITVGHDSLPVLIDGARRPITSGFYVIGVLCLLATALAMAMSWHRGWTQGTILHLWLAVALTASLADVAASLAANARYTVGWYFGRVESLIAGSVLMLVFLAEINRLYHRLSVAMHELSAANTRLVATVEEKDKLVAELQRSEEQVRQLAYYDTLTELPNRRVLLDRLNQALSQARRHHCSMAILFLDLDRFKHINDTLGHDVGDELLRQVARRLTTCVRSADTVSRSGGDEFIIVLSEIMQPDDAARVAEKVIEVLTAPVVVGEHKLQVTTSIGIAVYPVDGMDDMQALMKKADRAMYAAKDGGRNTYRYYSELAGP
jgi:diguanylate cyclase (GGDEF)-like protein